MLIDRGRLELAISVQTLVRRCQRLSFFHFVDIDPRIAVSAVTLGLPHRDPADRIIVATAQLLGASLVTQDRVLRDHAAIPTVW